jgi:hypothetical protein
MKSSTPIHHFKKQFTDSLAAMSIGQGRQLPTHFWASMACPLLTACQNLCCMLITINKSSSSKYNLPATPADKLKILKQHINYE